ncbi:hypothetical protein IWX47DRAFT_247212 [Phyllosticta citricarpa]
MRWRGDHCLVASNVVLGLASRTTEMILEAAVCLIQSLISKMWSCWQVPEQRTGVKTRGQCTCRLHTAQCRHQCWSNPTVVEARRGPRGSAWQVGRNPRRSSNTLRIRQGGRLLRRWQMNTIRGLWGSVSVENSEGVLRRKGEFTAALANLVGTDDLISPIAARTWEPWNRHVCQDHSGPVVIHKPWYVLPPARSGRPGPNQSRGAGNARKRT